MINSKKTIVFYPQKCNKEKLTNCADADPILETNKLWI
jgi:hypothetical protein